MEEDYEKNLKKEDFKQIITYITTKYHVKYGIPVEDLEKSCFSSKNKTKNFKLLILSGIVVFLAVLYRFNVLYIAINYFLGIRCIIRNNYFIWEATRPISDCNFCINVSEAIVLQNLTQNQFLPYAFSSKPILVKGAFLHWKATEKFSLKFFNELYKNVEDSIRSVDEECQFLHFKSDFISVKDVFEMSEERIKNMPNEKSWYVGWGNCHPQILEELRKHYPKPHFLPDEAEIPSKDYVFMGYDDGATMHLDFINRLMWQAQLKGRKKWDLLPPPECQNVCQSVEFLAEPGDAVLVDTRVWYHGTTILSGDFSLSIQSEYG